MISVLKKRYSSSKDVCFGRTFPFGKYKGDYIYRVIVVNYPYVNWVLENTQFKLTEDELWFLNEMIQYGEQLEKRKLNRFVTEVEPLVREYIDYMPGHDPYTFL